MQLNTWFLDCLLPFLNQWLHCIYANPELNQPADDIDKIYPSIRDISLVFHLLVKKFFFFLIKEKIVQPLILPEKHTLPSARGKLRAYYYLKKKYPHLCKSW